MSAGAAIANASVDGSTLATTGAINVGKTAQTVGGIDIAANSVANGTTDVIGVNAGLGFALNGAVSIATVDPIVTASLGGGSTVNVVNNVGVVANSQGTPNAQAFGVTVSEGVAIGVSLAQATLTPTLSASLGGNVTSATGNVTVESLQNWTAGGSPINTAAYAYANASVGGLIAGNGAVALATDNPTTHTDISGHVTAAAGTVSAISQVNNQATSDGEGLTVGLVGLAR